MPQLGESIAEATVVAFNFQAGEEVAVDQDILEVETQKATMGVTSPCSGRVLEWSAQLQQSYAVGDTLGYVECSPEEAHRLGLDAPATPELEHRESLPHGYSPADEATSFVRSLTGPDSAGTSSSSPCFRHELSLPKTQSTHG